MEERYGYAPAFVYKVSALRRGDTNAVEVWPQAAKNGGYLLSRYSTQ